MRTQLAVAMLLAAALIAPTATAQVKSCGDMELFIANPDMREVSSDGKYHVAGDFFMQFQVQGEGASAIESFGFSVGIPPENPQQICSAPHWWNGFMLEAYKADFDKSDGFHILMSTTGQSTPQNVDLTVAVHAYDGAGVERARFWTTAIVESCEGPVAPGGCDKNDVVANDRIQPWPVLLPGDGPENFVDGIYVDFAEPLAVDGFKVFLNGEDITAEMDSVPDDSRKQWDDDTYYDHGPAGIGSKATKPCEAPQSCIAGKGPAYQWTGRQMTSDDVVRVEATDLAGNVAVKEIHMAQAAAGGTLEGGIPILEMTFDETVQVGAPGETLRFTMMLENTGNKEGHPFAVFEEGVTHPEGWAEPTWDPGHKPVPPKGASTQDFVIQIPEDAEAGNFAFKPQMEYSQVGVKKFVHSAISVDVQVPESAAVDGELEEEIKESPAGSVLLLLLALGAIMVSRRRT